MKTFLISEACRILGVHRNTILRMAQKEKIKVYRDSNNYRRFSEAEIYRVKAERERFHLETQ